MVWIAVNMTRGGCNLLQVLFIGSVQVHPELGLSRRQIAGAKCDFAGIWLLAFAAQMGSTSLYCLGVLFYCCKYSCELAAHKSELS